jgi:hypothetical protein
VPIPTFIIGPAFNTLTWLRRLEQSRRKVNLTVHRADLQNPFYAAVGDSFIGGGTIDSYFINITNASHDRDIVVTHIWIDSEPPVHVEDIPPRLQHSAPWSTSVPVKDVPADPERVPWLARCRLSPDGKIIKSRPSRNMPPYGRVPRG